VLSLRTGLLGCAALPSLHPVADAWENIIDLRTHRAVSTQSPIDRDALGEHIEVDFDELTEPRRVTLTGRQRFFGWLSLVTMLLVALLSILRLSSSSLALHRATDEANTSRVLLGTPRGIRADEWNRATPDLLGRLSAGWTPEFRSVFEVRVARSGAPESVADFLQYPERDILKSVFSTAAFFPLWWLTIALCLIGLVGIFMMWGFSNTSSLVASLFVIAIPTTSWWSYHPIQIMWPLVGAFLLVECSRRLSASRGPIYAQFGKREIRLDTLRRLAVIAFPIIAGIIASRIPFGYFPWVVPAAIIYFCLVLDWIWSRRISRAELYPYIAAFTVLLLIVLFNLFIWLNRFGTLADTVYPGARRSAGGDLRQPSFTAAQAGFLQFGPGETLVGTNQSEAAMGPLVLVVIAILVTIFAVARIGLRASNRNGIPVISMGAITVLAAWTLVPWPSVLLGPNPLTLLPAYRVGQILGVIAIPPSILAIMKALDLATPRERRATAMTSSIFCLMVSVSGGVAMMTFMPALSINAVWASSVLLSLCVGIAIAFSAHPLALTPLLAFMICSSFQINPLVRGLGDLRDSEAASMVRETVLPAASDRDRVATDDFQLDALATANGLPMASGQVYWGPERDVWQLLDPDGRYVDAWNRGASSLRFDWQEGAASPVIWSPADDVIIVTMDPCSPLLAELGVGWVLATRPIPSPCIGAEGTFPWNGADRWIYRIAEPR
jgi:hypothetical protein